VARTRGFRVSGGGVIWDGIPLGTPVIPAKAGIQSVDSAFLKVCRVDSRFRGNDCSVDSAFPKVCRVDSRFRGDDCGFERLCLANDTSTQFPVVSQFDVEAASGRHLAR